MYKHALINKQTNLVDNVVLWDGGDSWTLPDTHIAINVENKGVGPGHKYNSDGTFTAPPAANTIPTVVPTISQLQAQLLTITQQMVALANTANT